MRTVRTFEASITNQRQVRDDLDQLGWAASKLWNVGRYYAQERWDETGGVHDDGERKSGLKSHERYRNLHAQSSQPVLEELAEAFNSWFAKRRNGDGRARPPGYRENSDVRNWGDLGNLAHHGWAFERLTTMLEYKAEAKGITVEEVPERNTSKTCTACGHTDSNQCIERGLYVCDECGTVANPDTNGAENIRRKVLPNLAPDGGRIGITAGRHSQRFACSIAGRTGSHPENRS